ncbi:MAG: ferritin family protein [Calditrichia bacterium]|nr:ferritin family protein [Calditrichia bacterium]
MSNFSPESLHALYMAMQNELDTVQIYEHMLNHVTDSHARELLHRLIVAEHNHEQSIKEKIISAGGNPSPPEAQLDSVDFPDRDQLLQIELANCTVAELVNLAIENEQMSRDFYKIQYNLAQNPEVKEIFKWLWGEEEQHIRNLKSEYGTYLS